MTESIAVLAPNRVVSSRAMKILIAGQVIVFLFCWSFGTARMIPKPTEVLSALNDLWAGGLGVELYTSLTLYVEALALATLFSLALTYATAMAFFRPVASAWSKLRFLGMTGLPFFLTLYISSPHNLKLTLLSFSISVFLVTGMLDVVESIPREKYDLARTLRMSEWQVVWEVVVLGRVDFMFDVVRQNAAIGWMMLGMVEALWRSEGGIGAVLSIQDKHMHLDAVAAIQVAILAIGLGQDYVLGLLKRVVCPYASMLLERR